MADIIQWKCIFKAMVPIKTQILSVAITICFYSCSDKSSDGKYSKLEIADRLIEQYGSSETGVKFSHNLILKKFDPDLCSRCTENDLIALADNYIDTVTMVNPYLQSLFVSPAN